MQTSPETATTEPGLFTILDTHGDQTNNQVHTTVRRRGRRACSSRSLPILAAQQCWMPESDGYHGEEARQEGVFLPVLAYFGSTAVLDA